MSDFSSLTGKFRIHKEAPQDPTAKVTKRPRESLACTQCKRAKIRCDRRHPCSSCTRKDEAAICSYRTSPGSNHSATAEDRLAHLESLVKDLIQNQSLEQPGISTIPAEDQRTGDSRVADQKLEEGRYVGFTHWSAILDDIQELKVAVARRDDVPDTSPNPSSSSGSNKESIIFGSPSNYPLEQVMDQHLPPRVEVDRLVAIYFQGESFIIPFIHTFQFQRQYRAFWAEPTQVKPLWLSMLFSICAVSTLIRGTIGIYPTAREDVITEACHLLTASEKCLVRGEYHRPQPLLLEALIMYAQCKIMQSLDPSREAGAIFGMVVRMAYEMGYHRDPDFLGSFSPFEGEMRRRFWSLCKQVDLMVSFQLGLPSNICLENSDTKSPRNLTDSDFDVDTEALPPSRNEDEPIGLLWFIVKDRQMVSFYKVCRDALSFYEKSRAEILQLDSEIRRMFTSIPNILRTKPLADSIADPPFLIMTRIYLEFIYLKSLCVFHRKYMTRGNQSSTDACMEAGQRLVRLFIETYTEFSPGGRLEGHRWMLTNFTMNDFLLGVMVLCLVIHIHRRNRQSSAISSQAEESILLLLKQAHTICVETSSASRDARYVSRAIAALLNEPAIGVVAPTLPVDHPNSNAMGGNSLGWLDPFYIENSNEGLDWGLLDSLLLNQPGEGVGNG